MYQVQKQKGITLIALVITIVVLIILAGVAINLTIGENGLLTKAKQAKTDYNLAKEKEELGLEITNIQVEVMSEENRVATLNDLYARIDKNKYSIELSFTPIATTANVNTNPTYSVINKIGSEYYFTVDDKLIIRDVKTKQPQINYIIFSDITWNSGKASITLSTTKVGTIEYKVGETGVYQSGTTISNLSHGDTIYARINNNGEYTEEETKVIYDEIKPEEFSVTTSDLTYNSVKLTTTGTTDNQTGLATYSYVAQTNGSIVKEIKDQTATEYIITGLSEKTEYVVYMLAYDNVGNVRKSNELTLTTPEYVPPQASNPSEGSGTYRAGNQLPFTWPQLAEIAKAISNNSDVTSNTNELTITYERTEYTIGVGDYTTINGKKVRILGFNHDDLVDTSAYKNADGSTNTKAGISFEYVDFITREKMNSTDKSTGGWTKSAMYTTLNTTQYNNLPSDVKGIIKKVIKKYCKYETGSTRYDSEDFLWLLSCAEIWGTKGFSSGIEGTQYKYYKNIKATHNLNNNYLKKPFNAAGTTMGGSTWWLRSPYYDRSGYFCMVRSTGDSIGMYASSGNTDVAPGFSI